MKGLFIKIIIGLLLAGVYLSIYGTEWATFIRQGNITELDSMIGSIENVLFFTFLLIILQNTFSFIPIALLIAFNVTYFGLMYGLLWSLFSSLIGSVICFLLSRYLFQSFVMRKVNPVMMQKLEYNGFTYIFVSRLLVFIPSSLINMAAGSSSIKLSAFFMATLIGNSIYTTAFSIVTYGISSIKTIEVILLVSIGFILAAVVYRGVIKRRRKVTAATKAEGL